jgi:hypothetical protein
VVVNRTARAILTCVVGSLLGSAGLTACREEVCDDPCLRELALEAFRTDYDTGLAHLRSIQDPVVTQATVMDLVRDVDIELQTPAQIDEVCAETGSRALAQLCTSRYASQHLNRPAGQDRNARIAKPRTPASQSTATP